MADQRFEARALGYGARFPFTGKPMWGVYDWHVMDWVHITTKRSAVRRAKWLNRNTK